MFVTRLSSLYHFVSSNISGGWGDYLYRLVLFSIFIFFLSLRVPYIYGMMGFALYLFTLIMPLFLALFLGRVVDGGVFRFLSTFVPQGTPL